MSWQGAQVTVAADTALARLRSKLAWLDFVAALEAKAGYDPNQPRVPQGRPTGGQWTRGSLDRIAQGLGRILNDAEATAARKSREAGAFVRRNRTAIARTLGVVQMAGGLGEVTSGARAITAGAATAETGVGVLVAGAGLFLAQHGIDNWQTGWATFVTGEVQPTRLSRTLRELGLSETEAAVVETTLAGGVGGGTLFGRATLERAARRGLERAALQRFETEPLDVLAGGKSLWLEQDIVARGAAWEGYDAARTGLRRLPPNFPVFDQVMSLVLAPSATRRSIFSAHRTSVSQGAHFTDTEAVYGSSGGLQSN